MATAAKLFGSQISNISRIFSVTINTLNTIETLTITHGYVGGGIALEDEMGLFLRDVIGWTELDIETVMNL